MHSSDGIVDIVSQVMYAISFSLILICMTPPGLKIMYGVLYAVSPELFATKDRGTGNGIVATANRIFGVMVVLLASLISIHD